MDGEAAFSQDFSDDLSFSEPLGSLEPYIESATASSKPYYPTDVSQAYGGIEVALSAPQPDAVQYSAPEKDSQEVPQAAFEPLEVIDCDAKEPEIAGYLAPEQDSSLDAANEEPVQEQRAEDPAIVPQQLEVIDSDAKEPEIAGYLAPEQDSSLDAANEVPVQEQRAEDPAIVPQPLEVIDSDAKEPKIAGYIAPDQDSSLDADYEGPGQEERADDPEIVPQQKEESVDGEHENEESNLNDQQSEETTTEQQTMDTVVVASHTEEDVQYEQEDNGKSYLDPERLSQQSEEHLDEKQTSEQEGSDPEMVSEQILEGQRDIDEELSETLRVDEPDNARDSAPQEPAPGDSNVAVVPLKGAESVQAIASGEDLVALVYPEGDDHRRLSTKTDTEASEQKPEARSAPVPLPSQVSAKADASAVRDVIVQVVPVQPASVGGDVAVKRETAEIAIGDAPEKAKKPVYKFQVVWDPVRTTEDMGNDIRHHVIMSPYRGESRAAVQIFKADLPEGSPLRVAVDACRERGIPIVTGCWKYWNNPIAILFDLDHMPQHIIDRYCAELNRDHQIDIPHNEDKARRSIVLGYSAVELIIQFEIAIGRENLSKKSWVRFHNWTAASGAIFLPQWWPDPRTKIALLISRPQLEDLLPTHPIDAKNMAREARVSHRYALELAAAKYATQIVVPSKFETKIVEKQLFRGPTHRVKDPIPNWFLKIKRFFSARRYKQVDRMREVMISDESEADNDLQKVRVSAKA